MLHDYQIEANKKIKELFKTANKTCFAASCGAGKNYMAIGYIDDYLQENPEAKVFKNMIRNRGVDIRSKHY